MGIPRYRDPSRDIHKSLNRLGKKVIQASGNAMDDKLVKKLKDMVVDISDLHRKTERLVIKRKERAIHKPKPRLNIFA